VLVNTFQDPAALLYLLNNPTLSKITIGLQLALRVTRMKEEGKLHSNMISMAKRNSCTKAIHIARECRDMLGGNGIVDEYFSIFGVGCWLFQYWTYCTFA